MSILEQNIEKLNGYVARFKTSGIKNRINGEDRIGAAGVFQSMSPVDNTVICDVAHGTSEDTDSAVKAASEAFPPWRKMLATERRNNLIKVAEGI